MLHVGTVHNRVFTADDAALLQLAADRAALAVQSLRSREDRAATAALQRSLLPSALPVIGGWRSPPATCLGTARSAVTGMTCSACPGASWAWWSATWPVPGSGAAVVMGRMRSALRSYALEFPDPADVLRKLDQKMQYFEGEVMATVSYAVLDPASGQAARYHRRAISRRLSRPPGGRGVLAEIAVDAPIGVADAPDRQVTTLALVPGAVLCFFTDGLVERRNKPLDDGIALLCETVSPGPPETVCLSVMRALVGSEHPGDDIALLVLRWQRGQAPASTMPAPGERRP